MLIYNLNLDRLKPGHEEHLEELEAEIDFKPERVAWLPDFFSLPSHIHIANSRAYQQGKVRDKTCYPLLLFDMSTRKEK